MNKNMRFGLFILSNLTAQMSYSELPQQMINIRLVSESFVKCTQKPEECQKGFAEYLKAKKMFEFAQKKINKTATREEHHAFFLTFANLELTQEQLDEVVAIDLPFPCECKTMKLELNMLSETTARPTMEVDITVPNYSSLLRKEAKQTLIALLTQKLPQQLLTDEQAQEAIKTLDPWNGFEVSEIKSQLNYNSVDQTNK